MRVQVHLLFPRPAHRQGVNAFINSGLQCLQALANVLRRLFGLPRQLFHLGCHHSKPTSRLSSPRRFNFGVKCEQVRLPGHLANAVHDTVQAVNQAGYTAETAATFLHCFRSLCQQLAEKRVVRAKELLGLFYNRNDFIVCAPVQVSHKSIQDIVGSLELGHDSHGCQFGILDSALQMLV